MKMTIESTTKIVEINGVPCRLWEGVSEGGVKLHCFITRIGVAESEDCTVFERELKECRPPTVVIPLSMIL